MAFIFQILKLCQQICIHPRARILLSKALVALLMLKVFTFLLIHQGLDLLALFANLGPVLPTLKPLPALYLVNAYQGENVHSLIVNFLFH